MITVPILAFGFANLAILGWLAAAAAPILIHLWMKRVHRETPWAAIRFLQAAIRRHSRRLQFQQWLLLAIRTAIILLVVLAAGKPFFDRLGGAFGPGVRTHRVLVIDASLSMQRVTDEGTLLSGAKRIAADLIDQSGPGDQFTVFTLANPPATPVARPTSDSQAARRAVMAIEPTSGTSDLPTTLRLVGQVTEQSGVESTGIDRQEIVFFSDLALTAWGSLASGEPENDLAPNAEQSALRKLIATITESASISVVDVGGNATNLAATELMLADGTPTLRQPTRLRGSIQRFAPANLTEQEITAELMVDGVAVASKAVRLIGTDPVNIEFEHQFRRPGPHAISLRLPDDRLAADDQRRLGVDVKPHIAVLCVEGRRGSARYLSRALSPSDDAESPFQPRVVSDAELATIDLTTFDAVLLSNVPELSSAEAERLTRYTQAGGGVAFYLGDRVRAERYNDALAGWSLPKKTSTPFRFVAQQSDSSVATLLPVTIESAVSQTAGGIDPLGYLHPIVALFRGQQRAGLLTTPVERYFRLRPRTGAQNLEPVFATSSGDPLMVTATAGQGRVVVVAMPGSLASIDPATGRPWTVMPAWPSFVPVTQELVRYLTGAAGAAKAALVSQPLQGQLANDARGELTIRRPDEVAAQVAVDQMELSWQYERTDQPGFYQLTQAGREQPQAILAVNVDPAESNTARVDASQLPNELKVHTAAWQGDSPTTDLVRPTAIHRNLLIAAFCLVLLETWLAYRFGRGGA